MSVPLADNLIVRLSFEFALSIIAFCDELDAKRRYALSKQLFRCGTSIGANVREAQSAESRADFIHKCKIAAKEAEESDYWLALCQQAGISDTGELQTALLSIRKILSKIIGSARSGQ